MCAFHVKSPEIVTPKSLASLTNLMHSSPMTTGGKSQSDVKLRRSSLHLSVFNLTLFLIDQFTTSIIYNTLSEQPVYNLFSQKPKNLCSERKDDNDDCVD